MEPRINPPSSLHRLTPALIEKQAICETILAISHAGNPIACVFLTNQPDCLYIGKLAVCPDHRGRGLASALIISATEQAKTLGHTRMRLETRIELTENHTTFARLGFIKTSETTHAGFDYPTGIIMEKRL
jgi:GNAT superfamily N-acetyltransferase